MGSRKVNTEGIDEELLLASIGRRTQDGTLRPAQEVPAAAPTEEDTAAPEPSPVQPVTREKAQRESGRRKRQDEDYNELFLRRNEIKTRQCVYISRDVHGKILRIVNDIAGGEISVGGYVDTVLRQHLEQHKERINELYKKQRKYSINSLVYWVTYVHNVVYSFYRSMIYCYINSTQRCAGSIVIDIIPTNGADKRKFFPFAPYFPVTNVIKRYFYPYFPAIIGIKGYSFPYFPYLSGIMKIKTALYSLFSRLDWHKTVVFPCLGEIYEGIRSLSWEIPVT